MQLPTSLCLLAFSLLLSTAYSADPLAHVCSIPENYAATSPYRTNLDALLAQLTSSVPPTGYAVGSVGNAPDRVNGLGQCRGDVKTNDCRTCISDAGKELRDRCHTYKGGIIWYDNCQLQCTIDDFFGDVDKSNNFYLFNPDTVPNPAAFNGQTKELLSRLASDAATRDTLFATGVKDISLDGKQQKLYGLVQCTRDLSKNDCSTCLKDAIGEIASCCDGLRGGRVVGSNCNFRYELYQFYN